MSVLGDLVELVCEVFQEDYGVEVGSDYQLGVLGLLFSLFYHLKLKDETVNEKKH